MDKLIAHVFPNRGELCRHMNDVFCEDKAISADKLRDRYLDHDHNRHFCFVIRDRDDIGLFLAFVFENHFLHGSFEHLAPDDSRFLVSMLQHRTRKEVA